MRAVWETMRPRQWAKNALLLAAPLFAGALGQRAAWQHALLAAAAFCLLSSSIYIANDLTDLEHDRNHPKKRLRPLAADRLTPRAAQLYGLLLATAAMAAALRLGPAFTAAAAAYVALQAAYSLRLKHVVILDACAVAAGFVLRAAAGAAAAAVAASPWFLLTTSALALFLSLGKRRHELALLRADAGGHRRVLAEYSPQLLDQLIATAAAITVAFYTLWAFYGRTDLHLMATVPFVLYGLLRYLYLIYQQDVAGQPEVALLSDTHTLGTAALWAVAVIWAIYWR